MIKILDKICKFYIFSPIFEFLNTENDTENDTEKDTYSSKEMKMFNVKRYLEFMLGSIVASVLLFVELHKEYNEDIQFEKARNGTPPKKPILRKP